MGALNPMGDINQRRGRGGDGMAPETTGRLDS